MSWHAGNVRILRSVYDSQAHGDLTIEWCAVLADKRRRHDKEACACTLINHFATLRPRDLRDRTHLLQNYNEGTEHGRVAAWCISLLVQHHWSSARRVEA